MTEDQPSSPIKEDPISRDGQSNPIIEADFSYTTSKQRKDIKDRKEQAAKEAGKEGAKENNAAEQPLVGKGYMEQGFADVEKVIVRWAKPFVPEATPQLEGDELDHPPEVLMQYLVGLSQELEQKVESARQAQVERLERLNQTQQEFVRLAQHFINPELRPNLEESALSNEPDQPGAGIVSDRPSQPE